MYIHILYIMKLYVYVQHVMYMQCILGFTHRNSGYRHHMVLTTCQTQHGHVHHAKRRCDQKRQRTVCSHYSICIGMSYGVYIHHI